MRSEKNAQWIHSFIKKESNYDVKKAKVVEAIVISTDTDVNRHAFMYTNITGTSSYYKCQISDKECIIYALLALDAEEKLSRLIQLKRIARLKWSILKLKDYCVRTTFLRSNDDTEEELSFSPIIVVEDFKLTSRKAGELGDPIDVLAFEDVKRVVAKRQKRTSYNYMFKEEARRGRLRVRSNDSSEDEFNESERRLKKDFGKSRRRPFTTPLKSASAYAQPPFAFSEDDVNVSLSNQPYVSTSGNKSTKKYQDVAVEALEMSDPQTFLSDVKPMVGSSQSDHVISAHNLPPVLASVNTSDKGCQNEAEISLEMSQTQEKVVEEPCVIDAAPDKESELNFSLSPAIAPAYTLVPLVDCGDKSVASLPNRLPVSTSGYTYDKKCQNAAEDSLEMLLAQNMVDESVATDGTPHRKCKRFITSSPVNLTVCAPVPFAFSEDVMNVSLPSQPSVSPSGNISGEKYQDSVVEALEMSDPQNDVLKQVVATDVIRLKEPKVISSSSCLDIQASPHRRSVTINEKNSSSPAVALDANFRRDEILEYNVKASSNRSTATNHRRHSVALEESMEHSRKEGRRLWKTRGLVDGRKLFLYCYKDSEDVDVTRDSSSSEGDGKPVEYSCLLKDSSKNVVFEVFGSKKNIMNLEETFLQKNTSSLVKESGNDNKNIDPNPVESDDYMESSLDYFFDLEDALRPVKRRRTGSTLVKRQENIVKGDEEETLEMNCVNDDKKKRIEDDNSKENHENMDGSYRRVTYAFQPILVHRVDSSDSVLADSEIMDDSGDLDQYLTASKLPDIYDGNAISWDFVSSSCLDDVSPHRRSVTINEKNSSSSAVALDANFRRDEILEYNVKASSSRSTATNHRRHSVALEESMELSRKEGRRLWKTRGLVDGRKLFLYCYKDSEDVDVTRDSSSSEGDGKPVEYSCLLNDSSKNVVFEVFGSKKNIMNLEETIRQNTSSLVKESGDNDKNIDPNPVESDDYMESSLDYFFDLEDALRPVKRRRTGSTLVKRQKNIVKGDEEETLEMNCVNDDKKERMEDDNSKENHENIDGDRQVMYVLEQIMVLSSLCLDDASQSGNDKSTRHEMPVDARRADKNGNKTQQKVTFKPMSTGTLIREHWRSQKQEYLRRKKQAHEPSA